MEIGRTFSTMMMNSSFRHSLVEAASETEFKDAFVLQYEKYKNVAKFEDEKVTAEDLDEDGAHVRLISFDVYVFIIALFSVFVFFNLKSL